MWPPPAVEPSPVAAKPTAGAAVVKAKEKQPVSSCLIHHYIFVWIE